MKQKTYCIVTAVIFLVVATLHVARIFLGWEVSINGWLVPLWVSWVALPLVGYLVYRGFVHGSGDE